MFGVRVMKRPLDSSKMGFTLSNNMLAEGTVSSDYYLSFFTTNDNLRNKPLKVTVYLTLNNPL